MEKIRICQMIDQPTLGGGQTALLLLAENLDPQRFEVFVGTAPEGPLVDEIRKRGLSHIPASLSKTPSPCCISQVRAALEKNKIQILHTHGGVAGLYGRWAARRSGTPVVVHTLHGIHYLHYRNPLLKGLYILQERILSRSGDGLILVSQADLSRAKRHKLASEDKMFCILNGIDVKPEEETGNGQKRRREFGWEPGQPVIGTVARLHRQKGIIYLVKAARQVLDAFPGAKIVVVGDGPLGRKLRKTALKMGLEGKFLFLGARADAASLMRLFDIFVLPSLWEGLPFVLVEAAALGKPIIATAVDGSSEIVEDGKTGLLIQSGDPRALAEAIISLMSDKDRATRLAERARAVIPPRFPLRRMVEQTQSLYLELYGRKFL